MSGGWREVLDGAARCAVVGGDCLDVLRAMPECSVEAVVTDPPYGLGTRDPTADEIIAYLRGDALDTGGDFMGREWSVPSVAIWREVLRVCKPGAHILCFAGTRTLDLVALGLRAAGFEFRDTISNEGVLRWVHGQGFPKGIAVGKAVDRAAGAEREVVSEYETGWTGTLGGRAALGGLTAPDVRRVTAPATDAARRWEGWNVALKPAWEPILCFRKPLSERNVAANVIKHGTGALNIDGCRVGVAGDEPNRRGATGAGGGSESMFGVGNAHRPATLTAGRWPSNVLLSHSSDCVRVGTRRVRGSNCEADGPAAGRLWSDDGGWRARMPGGYADADGMEEVEAFACAPGCPVAALDEQAGERTSGKTVTRAVTIAGHQGAVYGAESRGPQPVEWYGDTGMVSRFFPCFYTSKAASEERWFYCRACKLAGPKSLADRHEQCAAPDREAGTGDGRPSAVVWHPT